MDVEVVFISPTERYLLTSQKIAHGTDGIALYERTESRGLHYRRLSGTLFSDTAKRAAIQGKTPTDPVRDASWLEPVGWHGKGDRYLDFELSVLHGPLAWRGSYDTLTHRFIERKKPVFGPTGPRAPGEQFPETRTRLLTNREVDRMSYAKARYAINEIYARYGTLDFYADRDDADGAIERHFGRFDWYRPDESLHNNEAVLERLTPNEKGNLTLLIKRRDRLYKAGAR